MGVYKSDLEAGQKIVFKHDRGEAGTIATSEKVGHVEAVDEQDYPMPVKVRLDHSEVPDSAGRVVTYLEPSEIRKII